MGSYLMVLFNINEGYQEGAVGVYETNEGGFLEYKLVHINYLKVKY